MVTAPLSYAYCSHFIVTVTSPCKCRVGEVFNLNFSAMDIASDPKCLIMWATVTPRVRFFRWFPLNHRSGRCGVMWSRRMACQLVKMATAKMGIGNNAGHC